MAGHLRLKRRAIPHNSNCERDTKLRKTLNTSYTIPGDNWGDKLHHLDGRLVMDGRQQSIYLAVALYSCLLNGRLFH